MSNSSKNANNSAIKFELENVFKERYKNLNTAQKKAVDTIDGPLLVVAGPGSGKTEILSLRVAKILLETHALPQNILCMTFTESASFNMRERLSKLIGHEAYKVGIHTFHDFCLNIIQRFPEYFYKGAYFKPADPLAQRAVLEKIIENLPVNDILRGEHPEQGYTFLSDISKSIGNLKKAGITPSEFKLMLEHNKSSLKKAEEIIIPALSGRISKSSYGLIAEVIQKLQKIADEERTKMPFPNPLFKSATEALSITLEKALYFDQNRAESKANSKSEKKTGSDVESNAESKVDKKEGLSNWKAKNLEKLEDGNYTLKDNTNFDKLETLVHIYDEYRKEMYHHALFDFDDMILDAISAISSHPKLKAELAEQYQYILVDEFQDTNMAQMRLLMNLVDAPVNEGRPNIMVVGDDDQAVYKFQGAELSNILNFKQLFSDVELVTMTSNYRSTQDILDVATHIIRKGEERLENLFPELEKTLISANPNLSPNLSGHTKQGDIFNLKFDTVLHQYHYVSRKIADLIKSGQSPDTIAVISRKHNALVSLVPFLKSVNVPIKYEREQSVLSEPHIEQLIIMAQFVSSLNKKDMLEADEFLPKILAFPFWAVDRKLIWNISMDAYRQEKTWLEIMENHADAHIRNIYNFLLEAGRIASFEPLEKVLDFLIGAHVPLSADSEDDDETALHETQQDTLHSPFKNYYFNQNKFSHNRAEYLAFLSSLRVFVQALKDYIGKDYSENKTLCIDDLVEFVDLRVRNDMPLNDESPFASSEKAVNLMTAHKAKGLEFETVFVLSCNDEVWAGRGMIKKIRMPVNIQIDPAGDTFDDQLRLFYVALTRAKKYLYLTSYSVEDDGKQTSTLRFLLPDSHADSSAVADKNNVYEKLYNPQMTALEGDPETADLLTSSWLQYHTPPFLGEEEQLLKTLLKNYQLSVTHLNNFLNVEKGGPQFFLENNLLRFPQSKTVKGAYGTAVHRTIERLVTEMRAGKAKVTKEDFLSWFDSALKMERLSKKDFADYQAKGREALSVFFDERFHDFSSTDISEANFKNSGIIVTNSEGVGEPAHITGKIDRIIPHTADGTRNSSGGVCDVIDYKTGKPKLSWKGKGDFEKSQLYSYQRQLLFYKLLIELDGKYKLEKAILEFVEPYSSTYSGEEGGVSKNQRIVDLAINFNQKDFDEEFFEGSIDEEMDRLKKLICIVYKKILALDFPDVSRFDKTIKGIREFEDYLLSESN